MGNGRKNRNKNQEKRFDDEKICTECGGRMVRERENELVCTDCGLVKIYHENQYRGGNEAQHMEEGDDSKEHSGKDMRDSKKKQKMVSILLRLLEELNLNKKNVDIEEAKELFEMVCNETSSLRCDAGSWENWVRAIVSYILYLNCIPWCHTKRRFKENGVKEEDIKKIRKGFYRLREITKEKPALKIKEPSQMELSKRDLRMCIDEISKKKDDNIPQFNGNIKRKAEGIMIELKRNHAFNESKRERRSISVGIINYIREQEDLDLTQKDLVKILNSSEQTAREVKNQIKDVLN